ncbi:MAG: hypothetical protein HYX63_10140 [Gammaproteobacteria bacterium]|nr:hypothetical protein [Gammaproteobacteria bacterium]
MASDELIVFDFEHGPPAYTLEEVCALCRIQPEIIVELVDFGVLNPAGAAVTEWRFPAQSILRTRRAARLRHDLELNLPGLALALDLLDDIESLRQEVEVLRAQLERLTGER